MNPTVADYWVRYWIREDMAPSSSIWGFMALFSGSGDEDDAVLTLVVVSKFECGNIIITLIKIIRHN